MQINTASAAADAPVARTDIQHLHQIQLARRWHLAPETLERWRWLGTGPAYLKIGGRVVYRLEDVERFEQLQIRGDRP